MAEHGELHTWEVTVSGRVQGVAFRHFTKLMAQALGVCGWVRNEPDGSVTAVIQHRGEEKLVALYGQLQQGPPHAQVVEIQAQPLNSAERYERFEVRR